MMAQSRGGGSCGGGAGLSYCGSEWLATLLVQWIKLLAVGGGAVPANLAGWLARGEDESW